MAEGTIENIRNVLIEILERHDGSLIEEARKGNADEHLVAAVAKREKAMNEKNAEIVRQMHEYNVSGELDLVVVTLGCSQGMKPRVRLFSNAPDTAAGHGILTEAAAFHSSGRYAARSEFARKARETAQGGQPLNWREGSNLGLDTPEEITSQLRKVIEEGPRPYYIAVAMTTRHGGLRTLSTLRRDKNIARCFMVAAAILETKQTPQPAPEPKAIAGPEMTL